MSQNTATAVVIELMGEFARLTGLSPAGGAPRRYLWTDAFAVCNFLELYRQTGDEKYRALALRLVDQVHHVLGRYRADDERTGWISGLDEQQGQMHPTLGGLRIGKQMAERGQDEPYDETLEWDRDGQYFHYLTKWMHALNRVSQVTGDLTYNRWAIELAKTAHARFTYRHPSGTKAMYWKMSVDLSRPLVPSMGQHDPLDGLITYYALQSLRPEAADAQAWPDLADEIRDMEAMCQGKNWASDDPLGIGGLLSDACLLAQLMARHGTGQAGLLLDMLEAAQQGLQAFINMNSLNYPLEYRLAFRELGLSIGLHGVEKLQATLDKNRQSLAAHTRLAAHTALLMDYCPLTESIEKFWLAPEHQRVNVWQEHQGINMVMLATSLAPDGFLTP